MTAQGYTKYVTDMLNRSLFSDTTAEHEVLFLLGLTMKTLDNVMGYTMTDVQRSGLEQGLAYLDLLKKPGTASSSNGSSSGQIVFVTGDLEESSYEHVQTMKLVTQLMGFVSTDEVGLILATDNLLVALNKLQNRIWSQEIWKNEIEVWRIAVAKTLSLYATQISTLQTKQQEDEETLSGHANAISDNETGIRNIESQLTWIMG